VDEGVLHHATDITTIEVVWIGISRRLRMLQGITSRELGTIHGCLFRCLLEKSLL
jgi:hypothetical protein